MRIMLMSKSVQYITKYQLGHGKSYLVYGSANSFVK